MTITAPSWSAEETATQERSAARLTDSRQRKPLRVRPWDTTRMRPVPGLVGQPHARHSVGRSRPRLPAPEVDGRASFPSGGQGVLIRSTEAASRWQAVPIGGSRSVTPPSRLRRTEGTKTITGARRATRRSASRRGYGLFVVFAVLVAMLMLVLPGISAQASKQETETVAQAVITVEPGDSLWSVASRAMPDLDPRAAVQDLREANGLKGSALTPGQQLVVPTQ